VGILIRIVRTKAMALLLVRPGSDCLASTDRSLPLLKVLLEWHQQQWCTPDCRSCWLGDTERIAMTTAVLRRTAIFLGLLGTGLLLVFCRQVSALTFGNDRHATAIALLSVAVFSS